MSDTIGRITVPTVTNSGQTFPLTTQYPFGFSVERPVIVHRFGSLDAKQEQRYYVGIGPRKFQFKRPNLGWTEANQLKAFWESMQGPWKAFTYTVPNPDGTTGSVLVTRMRRGKPCLEVRSIRLAKVRKASAETRSTLSRRTRRSGPRSESVPQFRRVGLPGAVPGRQCRRSLVLPGRPWG